MSQAGLGLVLSEVNGDMVISHVREGGAADGAGVRVGDVVVTVDGVPVNGLSVHHAANLCRGSLGTSTFLGLRKSGSDALTEVKVTRGFVPTLASNNAESNFSQMVAVENSHADRRPVPAPGPAPAPVREKQASDNNSFQEMKNQLMAPVDALINRIRQSDASSPASKVASPPKPARLGSPSGEEDTAEVRAVMVAASVSKAEAVKELALTGNDAAEAILNLRARKRGGVRSTPVATNTSAALGSPDRINWSALDPQTGSVASPRSEAMVNRTVESAKVPLTPGESKEELSQLQDELRTLQQRPVDDYTHVALLAGVTPDQALQEMARTGQDPVQAIINLRDQRNRVAPSPSRARPQSQQQQQARKPPVVKPLDSSSWSPPRKNLGGPSALDRLSPRTRDIMNRTKELSSANASPRQTYSELIELKLDLEELRKKPTERSTLDASVISNAHAVPPPNETVEMEVLRLRDQVTVLRSELDRFRDSEEKSKNSIRLMKELQEEQLASLTEKDRAINQLNAELARAKQAQGQQQAGPSSPPPEMVSRLQNAERLLADAARDKDAMIHQLRLLVQQPDNEIRLGLAAMLQKRGENVPPLPNSSPPSTQATPARPPPQPQPQQPQQPPQPVPSQQAPSSQASQPPQPPAQQPQPQQQQQQQLQGAIPAGSLQVHIVQGTLRADMQGALSCRTIIGTQGQYTTQPKDSGQAFQWNELFQAELPPSDRPVPMRVELRRDTQVLAVGVISLEEAQRKGRADIWIEVKDQAGNPAGAIRFIIQFTVRQPAPGSAQQPPPPQQQQAPLVSAQRPGPPPTDLPHAGTR